MARRCPLESDTEGSNPSTPTPGAKVHKSNIVSLKKQTRYENTVKYEVAVFDGGVLLGFLDLDGFSYSCPTRGDLTFKQARKVIMSGPANKQLAMGRAIGIIQRTVSSRAAAWRIA
jgi:hypothetical protein